MASVGTAPLAGQMLGPMGPSPGIAIVSFMQGIVEIGMRGVAIVLGLIVLICAAVAVGNVDDLTSFDQDFIDDSGDFNDDYSDTNVPDTPNLVTYTRGWCSWLLFLSLAAVGYEGLWIVVRFLNFGLVNTQILIFLAVDTAASGVFVLGYLASAIAAAVNAAIWDKWVEFEQFNGENEDTYKAIRNSLGAASFFSFVILAVFGGIAVWMILFYIMKWNEKVVKYTAMTT